MFSLPQSLKTCNNQGSKNDKERFLLESLYRIVIIFHFLWLHKWLYFDLKGKISNVDIAFVLMHILNAFGQFNIGFSYPLYVEVITLAFCLSNQ